MQKKKKFKRYAYFALFAVLTACVMAGYRLPRRETILVSRITKKQDNKENQRKERGQVIEILRAYEKNYGTMITKENVSNYLQDAYGYLQTLQLSDISSLYMLGNSIHVVLQSGEQYVYVPEI